MARNEQLIRQHKLLQLLELSRFGRTLEELRDDVVADLGLSQLSDRTIRRDIEALQASGFDIFTEDIETRGRVWKLGKKGHGVHSISATASELIALSIGRELLYPLAGTQYWQGIESFWVKIQEEMPTGVWELYERSRKAVHVSGTAAKSYQAQEGFLRSLNRGILEHRVVEIEYQSLGKQPSQRLIEPYGLAVHQSSIYVVAKETGDEEGHLRHWKLDRFLKASALDQWFKPDPDVDVEKDLRKSIGIFSGESVTVTLALNDRAARLITEDPWHPDQSLTKERDNRWLLRVPVAHPRELIPRALSLGAEAEVLEPQEFREEIRTAAQDLAKLYA
jgi:predicted DNA-binding transcriptional regulator YafY